MTLASVLAHGASGLLDELIELGVPLVVFAALYWWSSRRRKGGKGKDDTT